MFFEWVGDAVVLFRWCFPPESGRSLRSSGLSGSKTWDDGWDKMCLLSGRFIHYSQASSGYMMLYVIIYIYAINIHKLTVVLTMMAFYGNTSKCIQMWCLYLFDTCATLRPCAAGALKIHKEQTRWAELSALKWTQTIRYSHIEETQQYSVHSSSLDSCTRSVNNL